MLFRSDKSVVGLGASYKMGFGTISNLKFTSEGIGLRSFIDWKAPFEKLKVGVLKGILISGGYEMNYNNAFKNIATLQNLDVWQSAGLLGITKKTKLSSPLGGRGAPQGFNYYTICYIKHTLL